MSNEYSDDFLIRIIKIIRDLYEGEIFLYKKILNKIIRKKENFVLFDKDWMDKWKDFVGYEVLKEKCFKCRKDENIKNLINEVRDLFMKLNTKKNLDDLGKMDCSKLINKIKNITSINELSNFIPILANYCTYFMNNIKTPITINSEISNGVIYIHDPIPIKYKEQKLIILYRDNEEDKDFKKAIITLEPFIKIKDIIKDLSQKEIDEILYLSPYKITVFEKIDETTKLKKINNIFKKKNNKLKEENVKLTKIIEEKEYIKKKFEEENKKLNERILFLENEINNKNEEIKKYISQINNLNLNQNMIVSEKSGEKIISILFMTMGNQDIINYSMPCRMADLFVKLEEKLYKDFPKYKDYETYFEVNTKRIKRFKTVDENNIKSNDIISIFIIEE